MNNRQNSTNINWYPGHMAKTKRLISENLNLIDVVYEVIDARMPYSSKIRDIEEFIKNKKKILIMTKIDLCDMNITSKWVKYYEEQGYNVIGINLEKNNSLNNLIYLTTDIIKDDNKKRIARGMTKRKTRVLVVGIPNAGKSTLINRLVGKKVTNVGNKPGITKQLNWIRINNELELLDTPGILWPKLDEAKVAYNLASFTAIKEEILPIQDIVIYILNVLNKYYKNILKQRYNLDDIGENIEDTLQIIGKRRGCLVRGGEVDYDKVYSVVINDVKNGIIKGITFDRLDD